MKKKILILAVSALLASCGQATSSSSAEENSNVSSESSSLASSSDISSSITEDQSSAVSSDTSSEIISSEESTTSEEESSSEELASSEEVSSEESSSSEEVSSDSSSSSEDSSSSSTEAKTIFGSWTGDLTGYDEEGEPNMDDITGVTLSIAEATEGSTTYPGTYNGTTVSWTYFNNQYLQDTYRFVSSDEEYMIYIKFDAENDNLSVKWASNFEGDTKEGTFVRA